MSLPPWFDYVPSVTFLMVGIVFVYVGFLELAPRTSKSMARANAGLLALPYALVFVINPIGETLTRWLMLWPTATAFLFGAAVTVVLILTAPGWLRFARRGRRS